jgi:hypothetical protein
MTKTGSGPFRLTAAALCAAAFACGKDVTEPRKATRIEVLAGEAQTAGVGAPLPIKVVVRTSDTQGPVGGVLVVVSTESQGGGSTAPRSVTTNDAGTAEIVWTLGGKLGAQTLTISSTGIPSVTVGAIATPGAPALVSATTEILQFTVVSKPVTVIPAVQVTDAFGNPIGGVPVTFELTVLGSVITGTERVSDANGRAVLGSWTIGPDAIRYGIRARLASGAAAVFEAQGIPATVTAVAGSGQTANAGTAVAVPPAVRAAREDGSPLPGVAVTFFVIGGAGVVEGASTVTGSDGIASASRWILGPTPGPNQVEARLDGPQTVAFTATGIAGTVASASATSPTALSGFVGNFVSAAPAVALRDPAGNPVAGSTVTFELLQADGQIVGATQVSDFLGRASLSGWRLGSGGSQSVRAAGAGFAPITFTAAVTAPPASTFNLEVRYPNTQPTPAQQAAFDQAAARWKSIILAGAAPYPVNEPPLPFCSTPAINETVNGLLIFANLRPIDMAGGVLGRAGPCIVRDDAGFQPAVGIMEFDTADLPALEASGRLNDVIFHEMAHVLGFGTMWNFDPSEFGTPIIPIGPNNPPNAFLLGEGTSDPTFNGASARAAFLSAVQLGSTFTGVPVPVEGSGGPGTRDSHWRESTVSNELMTGFLNAGVNPLSAFSAASFRDLGYLVNDAVSDQFDFLAFLQAAPPPLSSFISGLNLIEGTIPGPIIVIDRRGRTVARVPRK